MRNRSDVVRAGRLVLGGSEPGLRASRGLVVLSGAELPTPTAVKAGGRDVVELDDARAMNNPPSFSRSTTTFSDKSKSTARLTIEDAGPTAMKELQNKSLNNNGCNMCS